MVSLWSVGGNHLWSIYKDQLGPLLLNMFLCNLFVSLGHNYAKNYADNTTPHATGNNSEELVFKIQDLLFKSYFLNLPKMKCKLTSANFMSF